MIPELGGLPLQDKIASGLRSVKRHVQKIEALMQDDEDLVRFAMVED